MNGLWALPLFAITVFMWILYTAPKPKEKGMYLTDQEQAFLAATIKMAQDRFATLYNQYGDIASNAGLHEDMTDEQVTDLYHRMTGAPTEGQSS